jgi:hypothetical protein
MQIAKALFLVSCLALSSCTTIENDPSTTYTSNLYRTRIDFQPISREELVTRTQFEKQVYEKRVAEIENKMGGLKAQREQLYSEIEGQFADCRRQRHCIGNVATGNISRFERYNQVVQSMHDLDRQLGAYDGELKQLTFRFDLRERALYNRFLVNEMVLAKFEAPRLHDTLVHSLEAYPTRRDISERLTRMSDPDIVPTLYGDLNFTMLGKPVDEAAVIATFDIRVHPNPEDKNDPTRYFVTFLVNTHQRDPVAYSRGFLRGWARQLGEPGLRTLKEGVFCGLYSIAGPTLVDRLSQGKVKPCTPSRLREQGKDAERLGDRFQAENWILPIAFTPAIGR